MVKYLYALLQRSLILYGKLVIDFQKYGLEMNPYDPCFFNGLNNGKQLTNTLYVKYLKVSHMYTYDITLFAFYLSSIYQNNPVVHQGKVHDYLGIKFNFSEKGKVKIDMILFLENIFE